MYVSDANQAFTCREHWLAFVFLGFFSHAADFHSCCFSAEILLLEDNSRCFCTPQRGNGGCSASSCIDIRQPSHCFLHAAAGCAASISVTCVWSWLACAAGPSATVPVGGINCLQAASGTYRRQAALRRHRQILCGRQETACNQLLVFILRTGMRQSA